MKIEVGKTYKFRLKSGMRNQVSEYKYISVFSRKPDPLTKTLPIRYVLCVPESLEIYFKGKVMNIIHHPKTKNWGDEYIIILEHDTIELMVHRQ
jgi:hypothetical protein